MPTQGDCAFDLVDAITNELLFSIVDAQGQVWVCREEGQEFFLRVKNIGNERHGVHNIRVDGSRIAYRLFLKPNRLEDIGFRSADTIGSLKFGYPASPSSHGTQSSSSGTICFDWSNFAKVPRETKKGRRVKPCSRLRRLLLQERNPVLGH